MIEISPATQFIQLADDLEILLKRLPVTNSNAVRTMLTMRKARTLESLIYYIPHLSFTINMEYLMARKNDGFNLIDYRLSDVELENYEGWVEKQTPTPAEVMQEFATKGYKMSFTFVDNSQAWCVSITGTKDAPKNEGSTLTTWADEPLEGLYMAYYKVFEVFSGGIWKTKTQSRRG